MKMNGIKQFRKNKQGFLLVDAMIGVLVVAIGLAALAALYTYGIGVMVSADRQEKAVQIASEKIELLKAADGHSSSDIREIVEYINKEGNNTVTQDGIEYQINARGGDGSLGNNYPQRANCIWSGRSEVDILPQVLDRDISVQKIDLKERRHGSSPIYNNRIVVAMAVLADHGGNGTFVGSSVTSPHVGQAGSRL
ncbi:MAG: hypothetical protein ACLR2G_07595 [Phascolarctobacterium faecium]